MDAAQITALCAGVVTIITALATLIATLKGNKQIAVVQETVNGNLHVEKARVAQLQETMVDHGVPIPATPAPADVPPAA